MGTGLVRRQRQCNNPPPSVSGKNCLGNNEETDLCIQTTCENIMDGGWSDWSAWGECSESCGTGLKRRHRECDNPVPFRSGKNCLGNNEQTDQCTLRTCRRGNMAFS